MQNVDIIFFAVVALVLIIRLRSVLGERNEDETKRDNPYAAPDDENNIDEEFITRSAHEVNLPQQGKTAAMLPKPILAPDSLAGGIEQVKLIDSSFDEKKFLAGARSAFGLIVTAFANGDMKSMKHLLGADVAKAFDFAINQRRVTGERHETKIRAITDAELVKAQTAGMTARLTVRFVSQQANVVYSADGSVLEGAPNHFEDIEDIWTFSRDCSNTAPIWLLTETRS